MYQLKYIILGLRKIQKNLINNSAKKITLILILYLFLPISLNGKKRHLSEATVNIFSSWQERHLEIVKTSIEISQCKETNLKKLVPKSQQHHQLLWSRIEVAWPYTVIQFMWSRKRTMQSSKIIIQIGKPSLERLNIAYSNF